MKVNSDKGTAGQDREAAVKLLQTSVVRHLEIAAALNLAMTTTYSETAQDDANLLAITKNPLLIRPSGQQSIGQEIVRVNNRPTSSTRIALSEIRAIANTPVKARVDSNPRLMPKAVINAQGSV
jgi:hypothetical protein